MGRMRARTGTETVDSLLTRALGGDANAFGDLIARFQDTAFGYAYSVLGDFHDAQDAVQDAFITAYAKLADLRERERFPGWFRRIVLSACRAVARRRVPAVVLDEACVAGSSVHDPALVAGRTEMREAVAAAIRSLSPPNRAATVMFYMGGYSIVEVADFLQVPAGTVKRRLHDSRKQLRERMTGMIEDGLRGRRLPPEFRQKVLERIGHWERFAGSDAEKASMVEDDPEWVRLVELEIGLEPVSNECRQIRKRIASMEACHEHYLENVEAVVAMIGATKGGPILDCGEACPERKAQASAYRAALAAWASSGAQPSHADEYVREAFDLLGEPSPAKLELVQHLIRKLDDDDYSVYPDDEEDFDRTESRIQHLGICNYNWRENLRIVLQEISAGRRLFEWHTPDGYNAHGDCPDRVPQLHGIMDEVAAWVNGKATRTGKWGRVLGAHTPEKRWLAAALCKHVSAQHEKYGTDRLPRPSL